VSRRPDGSNRCDRCDADVHNGGPLYAVTISGVDPDDPGAVWQLHLCLPRDEDGTHVPGCRDRVLTRKALAAYHTSREQT